MITLQLSSPRQPEPVEIAVFHALHLITVAFLEDLYAHLVGYAPGTRCRMHRAGPSDPFDRHSTLEEIRAQDGDHFILTPVDA